MYGGNRDFLATVANFDQILRNNNIFQNSNKNNFPYKYIVIKNNVIENIIE